MGTSHYFRMKLVQLLQLAGEELDRLTLILLVCVMRLGGWIQVEVNNDDKAWRNLLADDVYTLHRIDSIRRVSVIKLN